MREFEQFDRMLATADSGNAWGDEGVLLAVDVVRSFVEEDWAQFARCWADRPEAWQCRAADVLSDGDERHSVPLLVDIIGRGSDRAKIGACDSLRVLLQGRTEPLEVTPAIKSVIETLKGGASGLIAWSLGELQGLVR